MTDVPALQDLTWEAIPVEHDEDSVIEGDQEDHRPKSYSLENRQLIQVHS